MKGITLDTGALIALESGNKRMKEVFATAVLNRRRMTVPAVVVAEWWREGKGKKSREHYLAAMVVDDVTKHLAEVAGEALGHVTNMKPDKGTIDALVLSSALSRGDVVYTSDITDLTKICNAYAAFSKIRLEHA